MTDNGLRITEDGGRRTDNGLRRTEDGLRIMDYGLRMTDYRYMYVARVFKPADKRITGNEGMISLLTSRFPLSNL